MKSAEFFSANERKLTGVRYEHSSFRAPSAKLSTWQHVDDQPCRIASSWQALHFRITKPHVANMQAMPTANEQETRCSPSDFTSRSILTLESTHFKVLSTNSR
jgi:hypothetical protein